MLASVSGGAPPAQGVAPGAVANPAHVPNGAGSPPMTAGQAGPPRVPQPAGAVPPRAAGPAASQLPAPKGRPKGG
jgi:hypothetical protein